MNEFKYIAIAIAAAAAPAGATTLTFDVSGGVTDFKPLAQTYGDNVAASPDANGHSYLIGAEGATPNVTVSYGTPGEAPALWTTGYGDLTNVHFNDADGDLTFTTTLTAASGFLVNLLSFDLASFIAGGQTIQGLTVTNTATSQVLFSQGPTLISGSTRNSFDFTADPLTAGSLSLVVDLTGLGGLSDDIGLDNLRFSQSVVPPPTGAIPEPATWAMMILGFGMAGAALRRRGAGLAAIA